MTMKVVFSCSCVCLQHRIHCFTHIGSTNKRLDVACILYITNSIIQSRSSHCIYHTYQQCFQLHHQNSGCTVNLMGLSLGILPLSAKAIQSHHTELKIGKLSQRIPHHADLCPLGPATPGWLLISA